MAKGAEPITLERYLLWTRDVSVSFAYLLPLLAIYECGVLYFGLDLRNSAELLLKDLAGIFGELTLWLQRGVLIAVLVIALDLLRREIPALRMYPAFLLESAVAALLLGPLIGWLLEGVGLKPGVDGESGDALPQVLLSLGAGVYEELVFRFLLLAGLYSLMHRGLGAARRTSFLVALVFSAATFASYHHLGPSGEPVTVAALLYRFLAGIVLGVLFAVRGLALPAYVHTFYDLLCDLHLHYSRP